MIINLSEGYHFKNLENLELGLRGKVSYPQKFCKQLHDFSQLIRLNVDKYSHSKDYNRTKWRYYYFFIFSLFFEDASAENVDSLVAEIQELFDDAETTTDELEVDGSELSYEESNSIGLATLEAIKLAQQDYLALKSAKHTTTKHLQNVGTIESRIKIRKNECDGLWILRPTIEKYKSKTTRWRHFKNPEIAKTRKTMTEISEADAERVMKEYYLAKIADPALKVKDYIISQSIPRSTFFKYRNMVNPSDVLNKTEKAYLLILNEKQADAKFEPSKEWAEDHKISYELAQKYAEKID